MDALQEELECPVCFELMLDEICMCNNGHNLCKKCKEKLPEPKCPVCQADFIKGRNYALEKLAKNCRIKCKNNGCNQQLKLNLILEHANKCTFKKEPCPLFFDGCNWNGPFFGIKEHVQIQHKKDLNKWLLYDPDKKNNYYYYFLFYYGDMFVAHAKCEGSNVLCAVMKMGFNNRVRTDVFNFNVEWCGNGYKTAGTAPCIPRCNNNDVFKNKHVMVSTDMVNKINEGGTSYTKLTLEITQ